MDVSKDMQFNNTLKLLQNQMLLDRNSLYLSKFKLSEHNVLEYDGSWDWTQVFTNIEIHHDCIFRLKILI